MSDPVYTDPNRRHDFLILFEVSDGNPNGDPDAGNMPRVDPETMQGLVTDVCLKRKVRNYVLMSRWQDGKPSPGCDIYVKEGSVLNREHQRAYKEKGIEVGEPRTEVVPAELAAVFAPQGEPVSLPEGFTLEPGEEENSWTLTYSGLLDSKEKKEAFTTIGELGKEAKKFCERLVKAAKGRKPTTAEVETARSWMCQQFYDIRAFCAVMSTDVNCGQVRGPIQFTFARSIDPIVPLDLSITRVAVTREEDASKERGMGRKALVPYGLYRGHGFVNPLFARQTRLSREDLALLWEALQRAWELDRTASKGLMALRGLYIFSHDTAVGNAPAHTLFERVVIQRRQGVEAPRRFSDYEVLTNQIEKVDGTTEDAPLPAGVTLTCLVG